MAKCVLHIEELPGEEARVVQTGDTVTLSCLLHAAMDTNRQIAIACMVAVVQYCQEKGIDCGGLGSMAGGHIG